LGVKNVSEMNILCQLELVGV